MKNNTLQRLIELLDYDSLTGVFTWKKSLKNNVNKGDRANNVDNLTGYIRVGFLGEKVSAHRLAWAVYYKEILPSCAKIDHINGVTSDNRIANLRVTNTRGNGQNRVEHRNGKLVGVTRRIGALRKNGTTDVKYVARVWLGKTRKYLGRFTTEQEANDAYYRALEDEK